MGDHDDVLIEDSFPEETAETPRPVPPEQIAGKMVWRVKVLYSSVAEFCEAPAGLEVKVGDMVVIPTRYGNELGKVLGREMDPAEITSELRVIVRLANPADLSRVEENDTREGRAYEICRERIEARGLTMKLVGAHYILDEQKILFFFTAENRVDFRELVKDLVAVFKMRIELRQIGVRDEARVVGGLGICGRALCCNAVTDRLRPVSIKMAKEQNLTLNSMKISGPCGRLLCCLSYEFDVYKEARQALPGMGTRVRYDGEEFKVTDMNILARRLRLQGESGRVLDVGFDSLQRNSQTLAWELRIKTSGEQPS
ncbi:MAG TPA: stage 0 sporulation family protein [Spirochaetia bacterium]|nr:stage 0 sporulation family protein [Spirochaetia bacterium]